MKHRTKDENFILRLYEEAEKKGDLEQPLDKYEIGDLCHLHPRAVDTICKLLVQANFIKKFDEVQIYLTSHGLKLVASLKEE